MKVSCLLTVSAFFTASAFGQPTWEQVVPVLERVCWECHDDAVQEGEVDLYSFDGEAEAMASHHLWEKVVRLVENSEMPPADEKTQPSEEEREVLLGWIDGALDRVARRNAGDPGHITMRRLTNTEYDNTLRDLTGIDLGLSQNFARDAGGGEGFTNTGDVLFVSPEQLEKYLDAAREVASRASIFPGTGIDFREEPVNLRGVSTMTVEIDSKLRSWYFDRLGPFLPQAFEELRVSDYLFACWSHHHGKGELSKLAKVEQLDPVFLENWWRFLTKETSNPVFNTIRAPWHALPKPGNETSVKQGIAAIEKDLSIWMSRNDHAGEAERADGGEWFHLCVSDMGDGAKGDFVQWSKLEVVIGRDKRAPLFDYLVEQISIRENGKVEADKTELDRLRATLALRGTHPDGGEHPEDGFAVRAPSQIAIWLPAEVRKLRGSANLWEAHSDSEFASVQTQIITGGEKIPEIPGLIPGVRFKFASKSKVSGDFLRAHKSMSHKFPGSRAGRMELTGHYMRRNYTPDGVYYLNAQQLGERLPEHERDLPGQFALDQRLLYLASRNMIREKEVERWDNALKNHLTAFAERVYRRPLTELERDAIGAYYDKAYPGIENREEAAREVIVRLLVSSPFLFKTEPPESDKLESALDPWALASRLSYFLWASMPDKELRQAAQDGSLLQAGVLASQIQRMLADSKSQTLATEFGGQWLGFRDFSEETNIDPELFPEFTESLRKSMQGEVTRFFAELIAQDRPVTDILHANYTYLDQRLADHYQITNFKPNTEDTFTRWQIDEPRGGILGMGAILAGTAFPDRASPVRRGDWILTTVLGYELPPVPADVPELENDGLVGKLPLRERLEKHRDSASCKGCHSRIDPPGFALQNFDAIGRWSEVDSEGKPINATATLVNGQSFIGPAGLKEHLAGQQSDFLRQFCTKLLGYALGREVIITDRPLLEKMESDLAKSDFRFSGAVRAIVESRQFLNRRNH